MKPTPRARPDQAPHQICPSQGGADFFPKGTTRHAPPATIGLKVTIYVSRWSIVVASLVSDHSFHFVEILTLLKHIHFYNVLRNSNLVDAEAGGKCIRPIKATPDGHTVSLRALIFPTDKVIPKSILSTLPTTTHFEIDTEPQREPVVEGQE